MSIMLNLDVKKLIYDVIFFDFDDLPYYFHGRVETNDREMCVTILEFCNKNNIACNYVYRNKKKDKFSVLVSPCSVEEAWLLFHQSFRDLLFNRDYSVYPRYNLLNIRNKFNN